jgi:hypothetical protein
MIELEHSPLGGSAAHRFMNCDGSFLLQREQIEAGQYENIETEWAKLGTAAHELGAKAIATGIEPFEFLGEMFNGHIAGWPGGIDLDAIHVYFNECFGILARRKEQGHMLLEDTIHLPEFPPAFQRHGRFRVLVPERRNFLRDYKNGEGIGVSAPGNKQLLYYGALMILKIMQDGETLPRICRCRSGSCSRISTAFSKRPTFGKSRSVSCSIGRPNELLPRMQKLTETARELWFMTKLHPGRLVPILSRASRLPENAKGIHRVRGCRRGIYNHADGSRARPFLVACGSKPAAS